MDERIIIDLAHNWHPFTQMEQLNDTPPLLIERAEGVKLYASDGNVYYDTVASWWCNIHGHCRKEISDAISKQAATLDHTLFAAITHEPAVFLSKKLCEIAPNGLSRVFYSDNGSCSVEIALKISSQYWQNIGETQKRRFICFDRGYHGDTIGAMSVGGVGLYTDHFKHLMFDSIRIPTPYCYRCPMGLERNVSSVDCSQSINGHVSSVACSRSINGHVSSVACSRSTNSCGCACIEYLEKALDEHAAESAAVIIEPMLLGAGGMITYPAEYIERARELTAAHNVHLIFDEVATGFGRTGKMFAADHANVSPDMMCLSKGLTGGTLPLAATLLTESIFDAFAGPVGGTKTFYHGHTFTANPIACAAANANLALFEAENTLANAAFLQERLIEDFESYKAHPLVGDVRVIGCCAALELVKDKTTKEPLSSADMAKLGFYRQGFNHGIILRPVANVVYLFLPLAASESDFQEMLNRFRQVMNTIC